ncbi:phage holin family protein [Patescibacteria group bacterium]|nr:phage holin family protein [Patescibacteria group bacterium]
MLRKLLKFTLVTTYALLAHNQIWQNLTFDPPILVLIKVAFILSLFEIILKPIIKLLLLPINILTLGTIRLFINTLGLYLAVFFIEGFSVSDISTPASVFLGLSLPHFQFNGFFAYLVSSLTINLILSIFSFILYKKKKV